MTGRRFGIDDLWVFAEGGTEFQGKKAGVTSLLPSCDHMRILYARAREAEGPIIEIGAGTTTLALALAAEECGVPLRVCDINWERFDRLMESFPDKQVLGRLYQRISKYRMPAQEFWTEVEDKSAWLVHSDGDHSEAASMFDLQEGLRCLMPGGYFIAHDVHNCGGKFEMAKAIWEADSLHRCIYFGPQNGVLELWKSSGNGWVPAEDRYYVPSGCVLLRTHELHDGDTVIVRSLWGADYDADSPGAFVVMREPE